MPLYLAVDAGGTKTRCLLADADRVLARASTGTLKLMRVSEAEADGRLAAMLDQVASAAGIISLAGVTRTCFGLAGLSSPAVCAWATRAVSASVGGSLLLCGDEEIALDAAFAGGPGILVVAGTGSNAIGRAPGGSLFGAGGWGPVLGDEGAGYWIGLEAIRAALHAQDRAPAHAPVAATTQTGHTDAPSILLREIQAHWNLASVGELVALANLRAPSATSAPPDFAELAPVVARCAALGNPLASYVLRRAGEELAALVAVVERKMSAAAALEPETANLCASNLDVAFTGSILRHITAVRDAMISQLALALPATRVRPDAVDPLEGALWRARHA
jgi:N-acetylglucosamine kinase-like BadF-type ATPase